MTPERKIIIETESLLVLILDQYNQTKGNFPENDIRPSFYSLPGNVLHSLFLQMNALDSTICEKKWWANRFNKIELNEQDVAAVKSLEIFSKHSFLLFYLSRIETNMKKTINIISPGFDPKIKKSFNDVYCEFLKKTNLESYIDLFHIVRLARNTVHSNGLHISHSATNVTYSWKGKLYNFEHLQPIEFVTFDELLYLFKELFYAINAIMNNPVFKSIPLIEDKFN